MCVFTGLLFLELTALLSIILFYIVSFKKKYLGCLEYYFYFELNLLSLNFNTLNIPITRYYVLIYRGFSRQPFEIKIYL